MTLLFILNDPPYGSERSYNGLRLARNLAARETEEVRMFLLGDAAACAHSGQKVPEGYYNIADMLSGFMRRRGTVSVCGTCMDARGIGDAQLLQGVTKGTLDQLSEWTAWADKIRTYLKIAVAVNASPQNQIRAATERRSVGTDSGAFPRGEHSRRPRLTQARAGAFRVAQRRC